ncbi:hypothetical protein A5651_11195 [Mycobacterium sp. 1274761.0]|nr:hypothetical protein A5651_11195 [Mycobacterium sp. 1274761.0]
MAGAIPGTGVAVVGVGVCVNVCGPSGPNGPSGSTTVVVGAGDVGLVIGGVVSDGGVVVVVVVGGVVVVVVYSGSFGRRTFVRGTHV